MLQFGDRRGIVGLCLIALTELSPKIAFGRAIPQVTRGEDALEIMLDGLAVAAHAVEDLPEIVDQNELRLLVADAPGEGDRLFVVFRGLSGVSSQLTGDAQIREAIAFTDDVSHVAADDQGSLQEFRAPWQVPHLYEESTQVGQPHALACRITQLLGDGQCLLVVLRGRREVAEVLLVVGHVAEEDSLLLPIACCAHGRECFPVVDDPLLEIGDLVEDLAQHGRARGFPVTFAQPQEPEVEGVLHARPLDGTGALDGTLNRPRCRSCAMSWSVLQRTHWPPVKPRNGFFFSLCVTSRISQPERA